MEIERIDYGDAIRSLSEQEKIDISDFESKRQSSPEYKSEKEKAKRITKLAQEFFVTQLGSKEWEFALSYLQKERSLSDDLIKQLGLGYAPSQSQLFFSYFQQHGFTLEDLVAIGLVKQGQNEMYAFFRDRLIIPIRDQLGNIIAFWARALQAGQEPKYLNSPESMIYDKSKVLYGLDHLKQGVKDYKAIVVVEWYFDVIAMNSAGMDIAVATCGTSLTDSHMTTLQRYHDNIYFLFDNDNAGIQATLRGLTIAYGQGVYPKIIVLSDAHKDIDELVRNNEQAPEQVKQLLEDAQDGFMWASDYYLRAYNINAPVERQKIIQWLFDLVHATKTMSNQNLFLEQIAQSVRIDYALVMSQYRQYIKTEKRVFRPRQDQANQTSQENEQRKGQKELLLWALLSEDFWKWFSISTPWIQSVYDFLNLIEYSIDGHDMEEYKQRQMRWEKELAEIVPEHHTELVKKVLLPYFHQLQLAAMKSLSPENKQKILQLRGLL